jgi:hypothetical protein
VLPATLPLGRAPVATIRGERMASVRRTLPRIVYSLFLFVMLTGCGEDNPAGPGQESSRTRLYLLASPMAFSTTVSTESGVTSVYVYGSTDWTATLAGDMTGTECKFGIVCAAPAGQTMDAKAEIIVGSGGSETVLATMNFQVTSDTYTRFEESVTVSDPECEAGDELILRITRLSYSSMGLGVMADNQAPNDSYIEVPTVTIAD